MKEVAKKLSRIEECDEEFTENDNETEEKDESYDDNVMLQFDEDGNFIGWSMVLGDCTATSQMVEGGPVYAM